MTAIPTLLGGPDRRHDGGGMSLSLSLFGLDGHLDVIHSVSEDGGSVLLNLTTCCHVRKERLAGSGTKITPDERDPHS